jgi:lipoprotein-releasing system ATP-binding protein
MSNGEVLLEARALRKTYRHDGREIPVLRGIDLVIHHADRIAIVGASGAGKSTLMHLLGTLDRPSDGQLLFRGRDLTKLSARQLADFRNRSVGFMFQFHHLLPEFSALENVMMPALIRRVPKPEARKNAEKWLEAVGLTPRLTHRPGELSGGEQQRVALARALAAEPELLLADEPTGNLDSGTSQGIHELFSYINAEFGTAMLIVTHNPGLAALMPRCLRMRDGVLVQNEAAA